MDGLNEAEQQAAEVVAGLATGKREAEDDSHDAAGGTKKSRRVENEEQQQQPSSSAQQQEPASVPSRGELKPYPFFYYVNHSDDVDPDPLTPLTAPGRVPNFPAKMHAILSRSDLKDVISWQPHGRSFKVHRPRMFEANVIPTYFEHSKFSSFIRQANGWGFRRLTTGKDRNSYYHPLFLRGLPHLCKTMKRPGVSKKLTADPEHEPDLYKIAEIHPLEDRPVDSSILLECTIQGGPKARMPIYSGIIQPTTSNIPPAVVVPTVPAATAPAQLTPHDQEALNSFQAALGGVVPPAPIPTPLPSPFMMPFAAPMATSFPKDLAALTMANQLAFGNAAAQFAAGFAAAAAFSQMVPNVKATNPLMAANLAAFSGIPTPTAPTEQPPPQQQQP